jgi:membrane protein DedA with SNARE-associated domain
MNLSTLIETHGYWLLAIGCLLEGETILLLAGFAAHRGYLNPYAVLAIASMAGFTGDQFFFWMGRRHGNYVLARWPSVTAQSERLHRLMERFHAAVIIGVRFAYGLRIAGPVLLGMSPIKSLKFGLLNALGAVIWAILIGSIGWVFGSAAEIALGKVRHYEGWLLLGLATAGLVFWWVKSRRSR